MEEEFEVIGTAGNGKEAFEVCGQLKPDLVLMDIRMPVMDGVLGTKLIKENYKEIKVVILTTFKDDEYISEAIKAGAEGYILKNQPTDTTIESLKAVQKGNYVFQKDIVGSISSMIKNDNKKNIADLNLTQREMEVLHLVGEGCSNKEIAEKLFISEGTARNYVTGLLEKLNIRDRTRLAIFYLKNFS